MSEAATQMGVQMGFKLKNTLAIWMKCSTFSARRLTFIEAKIS